MESRKARPKIEFSALAIWPNQALARELSATWSETRWFRVLAELKSYPPLQTLEIRLRQLRPDVVLLDLATHLDQALELIRFIASFRPAIPVVGLHSHNDPQVILRSLRSGATEFLHSPFDAEVQRVVADRLLRIVERDRKAEPERGKLLVFSSAKPGCGSSTLAWQTASALKKLSGGRVLVVDLDLWNGTIGFLLKPNHHHSILDALKRLDQMDDATWASLVATSDGVDLLPAPPLPSARSVESDRLHTFLEYTRAVYEWIIVDLPAIFHQISLLAWSDSDRAFLVSTSELPSLHLTRKAVSYLLQLGFAQDRFQVLINRIGKKDSFHTEDMVKIFNALVHFSFPNDYASLHEALTGGKPLSAVCALAKSIQQFAATMCAPEPKPRKPGGMLLSKLALSPSSN